MRYSSQRPRDLVKPEDLDALVTQRYTLDQINDAVADLSGGRIHGRSIIMYA